jgi:hypothetical protein
MQRNTQTEDTAVGSVTQRLDTMEAPKRPGPRFRGVTLDRADMVTLLVFSEVLCRLYDDLTRRHFGRPIPCGIVAEIEAIIGKAEQAAKIEVLQALEEAA